MQLNQGVKQKYPVLKNEEIRTENQRSIFAQMTQINLKTSEALAFRSNFKTIFNHNHSSDKWQLFKLWFEETGKKNLKHANEVVKTFKKYAKGIENAVIIETTSCKHDNLNGRIQSVLAKARGF